MSSTGTSLRDRRFWMEATRRRVGWNLPCEERTILERLTGRVRSLVAAPIVCSLSSLLGHQRGVTGSTGHVTADGFADFFVKKIDDIRSATADKPTPEISSRASTSLASFHNGSQGATHHHDVTRQVVIARRGTDLHTPRVR